MTEVDLSEWEGVVQVEDLMARFNPAYPNGADWSQSIASIQKYASEAAQVEALRRELREGDGLFKEPVYVFYDDGEDEDPEYQDEPSYNVGNGMHRIAATWLEREALGGKIRCTATREDTLDDSATQYVVMRYTIDTTDARGAFSDADRSDDYTPDEMDYVIGWLRSFRLDDDTWVETEIMSSCDGVQNTEWWCPHDRQDALVARVKEICASHGVKIDVIEVASTFGEDWTKEDESA
jgi:hypothetical protein